LPATYADVAEVPWALVEVPVVIELIMSAKHQEVLVHLLNLYSLYFIQQIIQSQLDLEVLVAPLVAQEILAIIVFLQLLLLLVAVVVETFQQQEKLEDLVVVLVEHQEELQDLLFHQHKDIMVVLDNLDHFLRMVIPPEAVEVPEVLVLLEMPVKLLVQVDPVKHLLLLDQQ
jgi:hypothetical protein